MTKRRAFLLAATISAMTLFTGSVSATGSETDINYYGDDAFLDWTGETYIGRTGHLTNTGSTNSWRVYDQFDCDTGQRVVHKCQQTNGMGGWIDLSCPPNQP